MATVPTMPTAGLLERLREHFIKPGELRAGAVCLTEVTAPGGTRRADLVHIGLWASRGAGGIDVCELKTSRSDFHREIADPAKAEAWWPYSSRLWIVSPHEAVTPPEELPPGWGLMVPKGGTRRFRIVVKPTEREPQLSVGLLVTLLTATETTRLNALRAQGNQLSEKHHRELAEARRAAAGRADPGVKKRLDLLDKLEAQLGAKLSEYTWNDDITPAAAADALRALARGSGAVEEMQRDLRHRARDLESLSRSLVNHAASIRELLPPDEGSSR
jgi:hypothetical protein